MTYYPEPGIHATPRDAGLDYEDVWLTTADGVRIHSWFVPSNSNVTWLWFHGNAGNLSSRVMSIESLHRRLGVNILIVSYRGYGLSQGIPSEKGTYEDARAALEHLRRRQSVDTDRIVYFGRSLGSAVAARLASEIPPAALILEAAFPSIQRISSYLFPSTNMPLIGPLFRRSIPYRYDTMEALASVTVPLLMIHGTEDEVIPVEFGREVFEAASEPKEWYPVEGAGHNDVEYVGGEAYYGTIQRFMSLFLG